MNTYSEKSTSDSYNSFKGTINKRYFNSDLHKIAYVINGNELVNKIREELKMSDKLLSIGELDQTIYATVLYNNNISYDKIPDDYLKPLKIHEVYNWLCNLYLNDDVNNEYL
jgi:hypothetical protein